MKKKAAPTKADKTDKNTAAAATPNAPADAGTVVAPIVAGNLGRITELRAQEEELTLEAKIAKLKKEKEEASRSPSVPTLSLPSLTPPASPSPAPAAAPRPAGSGGLRVISVQGVAGRLSATVRTGSGQTIVRKGSRLGDSVVTEISRQGVTIRRGGKTSTLPFE
ncbi:MAG: type IV pilus biogenesis protein PilP [Desulfovibrio sp.]|uniref:type IV pilus biogenesis protein PilP n=1 Tax=Desulfovibrio sp. TaxID=885 RepID=UPI002587DA84|nr:type IV pilus biogenesis protein PilP [Desulfovibrio sp.]MCD7984330.1 type IV pilus biogenesis protein PilP [Desulfovibrio sp.]